MDGKGFFHSTTALITALATLLAAFVALGVFLFGEGIFNLRGGGAAGSGVSGKVQFEKTLGRNGTEGIELDGSEILRNPESDPDVTFYSSLGTLGVYSGGSIIDWTEDGQPSQKDCADRLSTHGTTEAFKVEIDARFCIRSSGGRTAFLAVVNNGNEFYVAVWPKP